MAGYRTRVVALARGFGLAGFARNLPDGRIGVIAEGERAELEKLASALKMENSLIHNLKTASEKKRSIFDHLKRPGGLFF